MSEWPTNPERVGAAMGAAVIVVVAISLLGSTVLSTTANGIAVFMVFGAGLVAGLLGQIGEALGSHTLSNVATISSWILPFEALYQSALNSITADTFGFSRFAIDLGPFGGAQTFSAALWPYVALYTAGVGAAALWAFNRRDL